MLYKNLFKCQYRPVFATLLYAVNSSIYIDDLKVSDIAHVSICDLSIFANMSNSNITNNTTENSTATNSTVANSTAGNNATDFGFISLLSVVPYPKTQPLIINILYSNLTVLISKIKNSFFSESGLILANFSSVNMTFASFNNLTLKSREEVQ